MSVLGVVDPGPMVDESLTALIAQRLPGHEVIVTAALGDLDHEDIAVMDDPGGVFPIHMPARRGDPAWSIPAQTLAPHIQAALQRLADRGASVAMVTCAGIFGSFEADCPVVMPGDVTPLFARVVHPSGRVAVVVPSDGQAAAMGDKWRAAGYEPTVVVGTPAAVESAEWRRTVGELASADCPMVVLDCMGFGSEHVADLGRRLPLAFALAAVDVAVATCSGLLPPA